MREAFLAFLAAEGVVPSEQLTRIESLLRGTSEQIGSIAFSYGMLTGADIDVILDEQQTNYRPFGEIAVSKGLLTREQVETLLGVQQLRAATETAEALVLSGLCPMQRVTSQLSRFLTESRHTTCCPQN
jgi:hypothetical protein